MKSNESAVIAIERKLTPLSLRATTLSITTAAQQKEAAALLTSINRYADELSDLKETITKPLNTALKAARALFRPREDIIESATTALRKEMGRYQLAQETAAREEEEKLAARIAPGKGNLKAETAVRKMAEIDRPDTTLATDDGATVKFRDVTKFEVMDIELLPLAYHLPNEPMIREALRNGIQPPGVRVWTEKIPVNSR